LRESRFARIGNVRDRGRIVDASLLSATPEVMKETIAIRYIVNDVPASIAFYTTQLGFRLEQDASPAFASVSRGGVKLLLSGDGSSGKRPLSDGSRPEPGGWNRIHLQVADLVAEVARLRGAGVTFRMSDIVHGPGGSQILLDDPSGNPIELFQPRS
jgi:catechol 2,3-dioxygenase-like lactoylglutathione lyase family enzyme